ncbi:MAG TPA: hypothetical protein VI457_09675 [Methylococcaceae bacterium]|nr:hypothetical protein [Methylococcaceae bacterium]
MFKHCKILAALAALALSPAVQASIWQATLNRSNGDQFFSDATPYLSVLIRDGSDAQGVLTNGYVATSDDVVFTVNPLAALDGSAGSHYGIQNFAFNTVRSLTDFTADGANFVLPDGWSFGNQAGSGGFGKFDLNLMGTGSSRSDPFSFAIRNIDGDDATDYFAPSDGNAGHGNYFFVARLAGFDRNPKGGVPGTWFAGADGEPGGAGYPAEIQAVPSPAALWLLGSGLVGLLAFGRRLPGMSRS